MTRNDAFDILVHNSLPLFLVFPTDLGRRNTIFGVKTALRSPMGAGGEAEIAKRVQLVPRCCKYHTLRRLSSNEHGTFSSRRFQSISLNASSSPRALRGRRADASLHCFTQRACAPRPTTAPPPHRLTSPLPTAPPLLSPQEQLDDVGGVELLEVRVRLPHADHEHGLPGRVHHRDRSADLRGAPHGSVHG